MAINTFRHGSADTVEVSPYDEYNQQLLANTHPTDWVNPQPQNPYNLVVLGAGTAGLVSAIGSVGLGARVALIEKHLMGGDCLNYGCVPSKGVIRSATAWADVRDAHHYGIHHQGEVTVDFGAVMERMRRLRAQISRNDSAKRYTEAGVDVFLGTGRFTSAKSVDKPCSSLKRSLPLAGGPKPRRCQGWQKWATSPMKLCSISPRNQPAWA
jgi:pyruvate/2-oxoglutarate dehydrogenase complex dihydrolipoamide dehydrogenase (E3) component